MDVTEETFQSEILERSTTVPVVVDFWADWCQPCKQLSPILEKLAEEYAGRFVLAKVDIEANQQLAQGIGVQSIPFVIAVLMGQSLQLFTGAQPEAQVRQAIEQLLQVAEANGVTGVADPVSAGDAGAEPAQPARDPRYADADAALENNDLAGAISAFEKVLDQFPSDQEAKYGLARTRLMHRAQGMDAQQVRTAGAERPDDVAAQSAVADLDLVGGHVTDAFDRMIALVRRTTGSDRDAARVHLLELFEAVGAEDARVRTARQQLSTALF